DDRATWSDVGRRQTMSLSMMAAMMLAASAGAAAPHGEPVSVQRGDATYHGRLTVEKQQLGAAVSPGKMSAQRCVWTGSMAVSRATAQPGGATMTEISSEPVMRGFRPGDCAAVSAGIDRDIARRLPELRAHVVTVAARDVPGALAARETDPGIAVD
ncbi:MAG: hypothetical protein ABW173_11430, partial [Sphingomonas sp.]